MFWCMSTNDKTPILKQASDALKPFEPDLLKRFAKVFHRKKPPQTMRSLAPLAMVFLLEAFGLAFLLDRATVRLAITACRGPGKDSEDDDLLDDSDEMIAIRWAAARHDAMNRAYESMARDMYKNNPMGYTRFADWLKARGPDRTAFDQQWGERNPIDPAMAPRCFDPSTQLSILDAVGDGDGYLGTFVSNLFLLSDAPKQIECMGQTLDLGACETLDAAAWRAVSKGWIAYLDHRGAVVGLRLIPRTDGVQTRLRAPLANIVSMYVPDKRDEQIAQLEADKEHLAYSNRVYCEQNANLSNEIAALRREWQDATGASDPETARELTAQRVEQIKSFDDRAVTTIHADGHTTIAVDDSNIDAGASEVEVGDSASPGIWRMVWPDKDAIPDPIACANTIATHRRGEFADLEFPASPKIFENVRAWLMYHQFGICSPSFDSSKYGHCAIGANGEIPPSWSSMKEVKRNAYPGFVLFAPDGSARVVFRAKEPSIGKVGKRKAREPKS